MSAGTTTRHPDHDVLTIDIAARTDSPASVVKPNQNSARMMAVMVDPVRRMLGTHISVEGVVHGAFTRGPHSRKSESRQRSTTRSGNVGKDIPKSRRTSRKMPRAW